MSSEKPVWASVFCKETGETYRLSGGETAALFVEMGGPPAGAEVIVLEYEGDTLEDARELDRLFRELGPAEMLKRAEQAGKDT